VYFIRCAGFIKIGIADSVVKRLGEFARIIMDSAELRAFIAAQAQGGPA
jgi:hypothetical protein